MIDHSIYIIFKTQADTAFFFFLLSQHLVNQGVFHIQVTKKIICYQKRITQIGIAFQKTLDQLVEYTNVDSA